MRGLLTFGLRFLEMAMLWPSLLRKEMGDLVLAINAVLSSGLRLGLSGITYRNGHEYFNDDGNTGISVQEGPNSK